MKTVPQQVCILGGGNLGIAIAEGLEASGRVPPARITITRRRPDLLEPLARRGFRTGSDNVQAVRGADVVVVAVQPQQLDLLLEEVAPALDAATHVVVSTVSGAAIAAIRDTLGPDVPVIRAMPNLGIAIRESMTCIAADEASTAAVPAAVSLFETVGRTMVIREDQMVPATALCACGIAFFLRAIRAAAQGGTEIGFHAEEAIQMAAQTAKGAADLILTHGKHPESEIDKVTTPKGCTISGLNEMENRGFSSALVRGIVTSADKAAVLYDHGS